MAPYQFEIGDVVRRKPRGHKMIVSFVYTPDCTDVYLGAYNTMKLQHPSANYFYACMSAKTRKKVKGIFPEDVLEKVKDL